MAFIRRLVRDLRERDGASRTTAAAALTNLAYTNDANKVLIAEAGGIAPLVELLRDGSLGAKAEAARTLGSLAWNDAIAVLIAEASGIPALVQLLRNGSSPEKRMAGYALSNLAWNADNKVLIAEAGGIALLVELLRSRSADERTEATNALYKIARNNDANGVAVAVALGFDALVQLARRGRVNFKGCTLVSNAGLPAKRKVALVVAQLIEATAPRTRVPAVLKAAIGSYL
jgi:vacuolar protein 8